MKICGLWLLFVSAGVLAAQTPGLQADGTVLLPTGWRIKPPGKHVIVDTLPLATQVTRDGKTLLVLNAGYNPPSVSVVDLAEARETARVTVPDAWLGFTLNRAGDKLYVAGGARGAVFEFVVAGGKLTAGRTFTVPDSFLGDLRFDPEDHLLYAAELYRDSVVVINPQSGVVLQRIRTVRRPYRILFAPGGKSFFVSGWADGSIGQYDTAKGTSMGVTRVAPQPMDMVWKAGGPEDQPEIKGRLFVSAANTNSLYVFGLKESGELTRLETLNLGLSARQPAGVTPTGMGLSHDGTRLLVACSDLNAVAVIDLSGDKANMLGFIPAGWYPTGVSGLPDGRVAILNGKGLRSYANPEASQGAPAMMTGSVQLADMPDESGAAAGAEQVKAYSGYREERAGVIPAPGGGAIKNVLYLVREGRSYDQVFGDVAEGNGEKALAELAGATPNLHRLAKESVLLDNFYAAGESAFDGFNFLLGGIAPPYTQRLWAVTAAGRRRVADFDSGQPANITPAGYLWTAATLAGLSVRNYGFFAEPLRPARADGTQVAVVRDPVLSKTTDMEFRPADAAYKDSDRAKEFLEEFQDYVDAGELPNLMLMQLGGGRGAGTADNDAAIGMIVDAVMKSRFANQTAIFIVESDAGQGHDHVDSHRVPALVISPAVKGGAADHTMYTQAALLRTIEAILGLRPMTIYDAAAEPMMALFAR